MIFFSRDRGVDFLAFLLSVNGHGGAVVKWSGGEVFCLITFFFTWAPVGDY